MNIQQAIISFIRVYPVLLAFYAICWVVSFFAVVGFHTQETINKYVSLCFRYFIWAWSGHGLEYPMFTLLLSFVIFCPLVVIAGTAWQVYKAPNTRGRNFLIAIRKSFAFLVICFFSFWAIAQFAYALIGDIG